MSTGSHLPVKADELPELATESISGKFLTFDVDKEEYAIYILRVREIIGLPSITPVPSTPAFLKGVINLRGISIPVVDLRLKLGLPAREPDARTCIIVTEVKAPEGPLQMGIVVDRVNEVLEVKAEEVERAPIFETNEGLSCIQGLAKVNNQVKILLDVDALVVGWDAGSLRAAQPH